MDGIWVVYLFVAAFPGLIVVAAAYKYCQVMQASRWPSAPGRIVISTSEARSVRSGGPDSDDTEVRNFAKVEFEYQVATRTYRGDRIGIGDDLGGSDIAETLAKYPVGKAVTVYYNPNRREQSVIERDAPAGLWKGIAILVLCLVGLIVGAIFGFKKLGALVAALIPNVIEAPFVTACIGFTLVWALFTYAFQKADARARKWPTVPGRIATSGIREYHASDSHENAPVRTFYRPDVTYSYDVGGVRYTGDKVPVAGTVGASTDALARRTADKYPTGKVIEVHYNPDNPSESVLDPRVRGLWLLWIVPAAMLALAYYVAGIS